MLPFYDGNLHASKEYEYTNKLVNLVETVIVSGAEYALNGTVSPAGAIATGVTKMGNDLYATYKEDQLTEEQNGLRIIEKYLRVLYEEGGSHRLLVKRMGLSPNADMNSVIHEIAASLNLSGGLRDGDFEKEYRLRHVRNAIDHYKRDLVWKMVFVSVAEKVRGFQ